MNSLAPTQPLPAVFFEYEFCRQLRAFYSGMGQGRVGGVHLLSTSFACETVGAFEVAFRIVTDFVALR